MSRNLAHRLEPTETSGGDDTVLPSQFWTIASDPRSEPEKRLMVAVLEEAIALVVNGSGGNQEKVAAVREAERWFASDDRRSPFAFASICDVLGIDTRRVRETVNGWRHRRRLFRRPRLQAGRGRHQVRNRERRRARATGTA